MIIDFNKNSNEIFHPLFYNQSRYLLLKGGAGSGKSYFVAQKIIYRCLTDGIKHRFLVLRKTQNAAYKSCQLTIEKWLEKFGIPYESSHLKIKFDGHEIIFGGLDDPMKIKSIEGITGIWMEEATEFNIKDFSQLDLRLRGDFGTYKQIILSFNPEGGKQSWIYKDFYDVENKDATLHHSTWRDNKFIDEKYSDIVTNEKNESLKRIYDLGEWGELRNSIYNNYMKISLDVKEILNKAKKIYAGIDFGFNDPSVFLLLAEYDDDIYICKEIYRSGLTNPMFMNEITKLLTVVGKEVEMSLMSIQMYADAAEPARIEEFKQNGFRISKAQKKIQDGIDEVRRHKIIINSECINACKEIPMYSYIEDKDGNVLEEPNGVFDHTCDALRYGVYTSKKTGIIFYG